MFFLVSVDGPIDRHEKPPTTTGQPLHIAAPQPPDQFVPQLIEVVLDPPPAESGQIPVADLSSDRHVVFGRFRAHATHDSRISRRGSRTPRWRS